MVHFFTLILMAKVLGKIEKLTEQISLLSELCKSLKNSESDLLDQIKLLNVDRQNLQKELDDKNQVTVKLKEEIKVLKLAKSLGDNEKDGSNTDLKLKINEIVREVDRCMAMLNS